MTKSKLIAFAAALVVLTLAATSRASSWGWISNPAPYFPDNMLLMTDGTVLITDKYSTATAVMTPDAAGSYANGTWSLGPSMAHDHLFNSSAVLKDGSTIICGGELLDNQNANSNLCERLPLNRSAWAQIASPNISNVGDMASAVLPNGNFFLFGWSDPNGSPITASQIFNPSTGVWATGATSLYNDRENGLALTQDGTLLTVQSWVVNQPPSVLAEKYVASTGAWVATPNLSSSLGDGVIGEIGPAIGLPDGRVFVVGENGQTALYTPGAIDSDQGSWASGPTMPLDANGIQTGAPDSSAVLLPNGNVLFVGMPLIVNSWAPPYWFLFDPIANTITQDTSAPSQFFLGIDGSNAIMLLLPNGQVLSYVNDTLMLIYTPDGPPLAVAKPTLTTYPFGPHVGRSYVFGGLGLHGLSQACAYNDEYQSATNYPLIRLVDSNGATTYAQTRNFSTMATTPGLHSGGQMIIPSTLAPGAYSLSVVVNGVASDPVAVTVFP